MSEKKLNKKSQNLTEDSDKFKPIQEAKQFIENWYSNKTSQQIYNNNVNDYHKQMQWEENNYDLFKQQADLNNQIQNIEFINDNGQYDEYLQPFRDELDALNNTIIESRKQHMSNPNVPLYKWSIDKTNDKLKYNLYGMNRSPYGFYDSQEYVFPNEENKNQYDPIIKHHNYTYETSPGVMGLFNGNVFTYRNQNEAEKAKGHEEMHAAQLIESASVLQRILEEHGYTDSPYLDSGNEGLSRLMNVRILNNLKPGDRNWNARRVKRLQRKNKGDDRFLDRYDAETIADIFNLVADNNKPSFVADDQSGAMYAKCGKKLIKRKRSKK